MTEGLCDILTVHGWQGVIPFCDAQSSPRRRCSRLTCTQQRRPVPRVLPPCCERERPSLTGAAFQLCRSVLQSILSVTFLAKQWLLLAVLDLQLSLPDEQRLRCAETLFVHLQAVADHEVACAGLLSRTLPPLSQLPYFPSGISWLQACSLSKLAVQWAQQACALA